jgi:hypothetical protein
MMEAHLLTNVDCESLGASAMGVIGLEQIVQLSEYVALKGRKRDR